MAKISVYIESDSPSDFRATLQELIGNTVAPIVPETEKVTPEPTKPAKPKKITTENKVELTPTLEPTATPEPAADPAPAAKEKKITHEDLRDAMHPLKREISLQLVAEFSGKTPEEKPKLSDVPAEKHAELLAEARRLAQLPENVKQAIA